MLFSSKCFIAAMLALYISFRIGLTRPFWAIGTVYIVSQPMVGASLSRGLFRLLGTTVGAIATVLLVPALANEPFVLSTALAGWIGLCLYFALLDRTPRAYAFLLAGYTTSLIGFPSVTAPGEVFTAAAMRLQEISIGVLCATLVHGLILPRRVSQRVGLRVAAILVDTECWTRDMLAGARGMLLARDRTRAASDLLELHQLSVHLPFDTSTGVHQVALLRALHGRLLEVITRSGALDDALAELRAAGSALPCSLAALATRSAHWLGSDPDQRDTAMAAMLAEQLTRWDAQLSPSSEWEALRLRGIARDLAALLLAHHDGRLLQAALKNPVPGWQRHVPARITRHAAGHVLHRDRWLAMRSALGLVAGIVLGCVFWIETAWANGATAISVMGAVCALSGTVEAPAPSVIRYLQGTFIGVGLGLFYGLVVLPLASDFTTLAIALAPALLVIGSFQGRPAYIPGALGAVLTFPVVAGLGPTNRFDFAATINDSVALIIGMLMTLVSVSLFQTIGTPHSRGRLLSALRRGAYRKACARVTDHTAWTSTMLDRAGLLAARLPPTPASLHTLRVVLADVRSSATAAALRNIAPALPTPGAREATERLLQALTASYRIPIAATHAPEFLSLFDDARRALIDAPASADALALLSDLRRDVLARVAVDSL